MQQRGTERSVVHKLFRKFTLLLSQLLRASATVLSVLYYLLLKYYISDTISSPTITIGML